MTGLIGLFVLIAVCHARIETHHFVHVHEDGKIIPQDIIHDIEANTVLVVVGDVSEYENVFPTVNFHDFDTGYVVFKDIKQKICTLSRAPIPNAIPEIYRLGGTNFSIEYTATYDHTPMPYSSVSHVAGTRIADFCKDYITFRSILHHKNRNVRGLEQRQPTQPCERYCVICIVQSDIGGYQSLNQRAFG